MHACARDHISVISHRRRLGGHRRAPTPRSGKAGLRARQTRAKQPSHMQTSTRRHNAHAHTQYHAAGPGGNGEIHTRGSAGARANACARARAHELAAERCTTHKHASRHAPS
eukprot:6202895-Pleurochrysis_carterae.AAC.2